MDQDSKSRIGSALERLFRAYPSSDRADADVRERLERLKLYVEAVEMYEVCDVEAAVQSIVTASAPGLNASFLPPAPALAAETRRLMNVRLDSEQRQKLRQPALMPPDIEHDAESRVRVKAKVDQLVADMAERHRTEQSTQDRNKLFDTTNARFKPDPSAEATRRRLGFTVGDPEGDEAAA